MQHPVTKARRGPEIPRRRACRIARARTAARVVAEWLTAPDNPFFARNIANIVWAHFFGIGIVEPVDDVRLSNPPSNPELLDALAARLRESRYDLRDLVRLISAIPTPTSASPRRIRPTRSTSATSPAPWSAASAPRSCKTCLAAQTETQNKFKGLPLGARAVQIADGNVSNYFLTTFGRATRATVCSCEVKLEPNLSQALHLINGETVHQQNPARRRGQILARRREEAPPTSSRSIYRRSLARPPTRCRTRRA